MRNSAESREDELYPDEALVLAEKTAAEAGRLVLEMREQHKLDTQAKSAEESNIVTAADHASEKLIIEAIRSVYPHHTIRGEEGSAAQGTEPYEWIIDPIDGTLNFSTGKPFSISIGLQKDGESLLGVLYFPDDGVTLKAIKGQGAFRNGQRIERRPAVALKDAKIGVDVSSGGDTANEMKTYYHPFETSAASVDRPFCCTAAARGIIEGRYDGYMCGGGLTPYDMGAMPLILREAGYVADGIFGPIDLTKEKTPFIAATDDALRREILERLGK